MDEAYILIIRNGVNAFTKSNKLLDEHKKLKPDKKALMKGKVVNKHARYNLCFSDKNRKPDYSKGKGTIISFDDVPNTCKIKDNLYKYFGNKAKKLKCEANYYYDLSKCYIGFHGDTERKIVIGARLGDDFPLYFRWYTHFEAKGKLMKIKLKHGDLYIMSDKAVGTDWKSSSIYTLRHAAGDLSLFAK